MKTNLKTNPHQPVLAINLCRLSGLIWFCAMMGFLLNTEAQTPVCGNISGTWTPAGNPYIIACNSTIPSGQTLTIQPGVVIWIGSNVTLTASGLIQAVGTTSQRITFQAPTSSQFWNNISLNGTSGSNIFTYCDFRNATNGIKMLAVGGGFLNVLAANCTFSNCVAQAIYGESWGYGFSATTVNLVLKNCSFDNTGDGCAIWVTWNGYATGYANLQANGNIFRNLSGKAIHLTTAAGAGSSLAAIVNNTLANCAGGIDAADPWNATVQSCIFVGCSNAVRRSGSLSTAVSYNDFYLNATNFTGYQGAYGTPIIANRNGTSSDLLFNIFQNPLFVGTSDYHLTVSSTCIDAGVGDPANFDSCFPPSLGSVTNDIGAYGGPNGCAWIFPPSTNIFTVALARYVGVTINPPTNGHYRLEYASVLSGTNNWIQLTNLTLSAPFIYYDPVLFGQRYYRAVLLYP